MTLTAEKMCRRCNEPFKLQSRAQRYCSEECFVANRNERANAYYHSNKDAISGRSADYRLRNADAIRERKAAAYKRDREKIAERQQTYYIANADAIKAKSLRWYYDRRPADMPERVNGMLVDPKLVTYAAAHARVKAARGPAKEMPCEKCTEPAKDWCYDYADPDEQFNPVTGSPYSVDPFHYRALCRTCHRRFDSDAHDRRAVERVFAVLLVDGIVSMDDFDSVVSQAIEQSVTLSSGATSRH